MNKTGFLTGKTINSSVISTIMIIMLFSILSSHSLLAHDNQDTSIGTVNLPVACSEEAAKKFQLGIANLHHMMYGNARKIFREVQTADPKCAMAKWGEAMTYIHPLWPDRPSKQELLLGHNLIAEALSIGGLSTREKAYINTGAAYFKEAINKTERERLLDFETAWEKLYQMNIKDQEAKAFYILSQLATVDLEDKSYSKQQQVGAMAIDILKDMPDHPGALHYTIHSFDFQGIADQALEVARYYNKIAPEVPHALHMPTHTFTRLGLWKESAEWNFRSAKAALKKDGRLAVHYFHALDYMTYAYLQTGDDEKAVSVIHTMANYELPYGSVNRSAQAYALAASPARLSLERQDWQAASKLKPRMPERFPWQQSHDVFVAMTHFAKGLGLAHLKQFNAAEKQVVLLEKIYQQSVNNNPAWATKVNIQKLIVQAWIAYLKGDIDDGISTMKKAAKLESNTDKGAVSPGEVMPASELLANMLMEQGHYMAAITYYQQALIRNPRRLNSLYGMAQSLEKMGQPIDAKVFYAEISAMSVLKSSRPEIIYANNYLKRN